MRGPQTVFFLIYLFCLTKGCYRLGLSSNLQGGHQSTASRDPSPESQKMIAYVSLSVICALRYVFL